MAGAGRLINVDGIDHGGVNGGDGESDGALADALGEDFAALGFELLAIVETADGAIGGKDDGGGDDGAEEGAAADLIDPGNGVETARAQFPLQRSLAADFAGDGNGPHGDRGW